jgi:Ca2+-binding EF-hand superfamily protein
MPIGDVDPDEYFLQPEMEEMRKVFDQYDGDGSGSVTSTELKPLFGAVGINMKPYQIDAIVREYDLDGSGEIDFEEFVVMMIKLLGRRVRCDCIDYREYLTEDMVEKYEEYFRLADTSGDGRLGHDEVEKMVKRIGVQLSKDQLDEIFREVDKDGSGEIEFDEYCAMMVKLTGVRKRINAREYIDRADIDNYRQAFNNFDTSGDGTISAKELDRLLRKMEIVLRVDQVESLLTKYDADGSGEIDFVEFLSMMVDLKKLRRARKINPETYSVKQLMEMGFSAAEVKTSGFTPQLMRQENWPVREMTKAFKPLELRHAGYSAKDLLWRIGRSSAQAHRIFLVRAAERGVQRGRGEVHERAHVGQAGYRAALRLPEACLRAEGAGPHDAEDTPFRRRQGQAQPRGPEVPAPERHAEDDEPGRRRCADGSARRRPADAYAGADGARAANSTCFGLTARPPRDL